MPQDDLSLAQYTALGAAAGAGVGGGLNYVVPETVSRAAIPMGAVIGGLAGFGKGLNSMGNTVPSPELYPGYSQIDQLQEDNRAAVKLAAIVGSAVASRIAKPLTMVKPIVPKAPAVQAVAKQPGLGTTTLGKHENHAVGKPSGGSAMRPG